MPHLVWDSKTSPTPKSVQLKRDSLVYPHGKGYPGFQPQNQLIQGDNLEILFALLPEWEERIQVIYADPPFFTNRRYHARVGRDEDSRRPEEWQLAEGYPDTWSNLDAYLDMLYPRLALMHRLLAPSGTLYLHLDWHANAYARLLLDEIFGEERLLNEIIWVYHGPSPIRSAFNRKHDTILAYTKTPNYIFNADAVRLPYDPITVRTFNSSPKAGFGKLPDLARGKVPEDWWYFPVVARLHNERTGYPTQKPEGLLERIILASSNPGDLVADFFCGSGTTAVVADRLQRRFIVSDITSRAIHTSRSRLVAQPAQPFSISYIRGINPEVIIKEPPPSWHISPGEISLDPIDLEEIDYWEVDVAWNGETFTSVAQATRTRKKSNIANRLLLPESKKDRPMSIRMVTSRGQVWQYTLEQA